MTRPSPVSTGRAASAASHPVQAVVHKPFPLGGQVPYAGAPGGALPWVTPALRRSVRSSVDSPPLIHAVPGSKPTWPNWSTMVPLRSSVNASSPLKLMTLALVSWQRGSVVAAMLGWHNTNVAPAGSIPLRVSDWLGVARRTSSCSGGAGRSWRAAPPASRAAPRAHPPPSA